MYTLGCILSCVTFIACESEPIAEMDERLDPYVQSFLIEAEHRDLALQADNLIGIISDLEDASGQCAQGTAKTLRIDSEFWQGSTHLQREFLVFHELGHCLLDRRHLDTSNDDGTCTSIMHSSNLVCTIAYTSETRKDYLDELFTVNTSADD